MSQFSGSTHGNQSLIYWIRDYWTSSKRGGHSSHINLPHFMLRKGVSRALWGFTLNIYILILKLVSSENELCLSNMVVDFMKDQNYKRGWMRDWNYFLTNWIVTVVLNCFCKCLELERNPATLITRAQEMQETLEWEG